MQNEDNRYKKGCKCLHAKRDKHVSVLNFSLNADSRPRKYFRVPQIIVYTRNIQYHRIKKSLDETGLREATHLKVFHEIITKYGYILLG